jgi:Ion transport protein
VSPSSSTQNLLPPEDKQSQRQPSLLYHNLHTTKQKSFVYIMLNPRSRAVQAVVFKWFMTLVICFDLIVFVTSTEPAMMTDEWAPLFYHWEAVTSTIFLLEYIGRCITVTESTKYGTMGPLQGRLRYLTTSSSAIVDALATLPFFLELITGVNLPTLTWIRSFRLLRILKTSGFAQATYAVWRVIYYNRQILYVALMICCLLIVFTSVLMYYLRPQFGDNDDDAPDFERKSW